MTKLSEQVNRKFVESTDISDWQVETEDGFVDIKKLHKTVEYEVWQIKLENGTKLKCADTHILIDENYNEVFAHLSLGKNIRTKFGISKVISVENLGYSENMYDLEIDSDKHTYYTNDILSHNTTSLVASILHFVIFNDEKTVALLANKGDTAIEILNRIQLAYENLPNWMQHGVVEYNKKSMELENKSRILAGTTSSDSIRGYAISFLYIDECAFVENWTDFYRSVYPTISSGRDTKVVFTSCVPKNTLIYTTNGLQYIGDFVDDSRPDGYGYYVPEYIIQGHTKTRTSNIIHNDGFKPTRIITTQSGDIESTHTHKFWAYREGSGYNWYKSSELNVGDYISSQAGYDLWGDWVDCSDFKPTINGYIKNEFTPKILTPEISYLVGLYIAEGCRNNDGSITITCGDDISHIIEQFGLTYYKRDYCHYQISSKNLIEFFEYIGLDIKNTAKNKVIPQKMMRTSKENISAMLRGMFDGDGCIRIKDGQSRVSYTSTSKELIKQVKMLLLNYGIFSNVYDNITKPTKIVKVVSHSQTLELNARDSLKYCQEIGFGLKRKQDRILLNTKLRNGSPNDIVPNSYNILKQCGAKCFINMHIPKNPNISRHKLLELKPKIEASDYYGSDKLREFYHDNVSQNIRWEVIKKITDSENRVYDVSLPETDDKFCHSVVYNGYITHNTPCGLNHYYDLWIGALPDAPPEIKNEFIPIKVTWKDVPGRDEKWKQQTIANTSMEAFIQEHEAEFIGSSGTLIEGWKLKELISETPIQSTKYSRIYQAPEKNAEYVICCDVSRGRGIDNSSFSVIKVSSLPYRVCATYYCDNIPPDMYAEVIYQAHVKYNLAYVLVENNDAGCETLRVLHDVYECESILGTIHGTVAGDKRRVTINGSGSNYELGIRTTKSTKSIGCSRLKVMVENNTLHINDKITIDELNRFSRKGASYEAEVGSHDDAVMPLVMFSWLTTQDIFEGLTNINVRQDLREKIKTKLDDDLVPFGYIIDGSNNDQDENITKDLLGYSISLPTYEDYFEAYKYNTEETTVFDIP